MARSVQTEIYRALVAQLEESVGILGKHFPSPMTAPYGNHYVYRHKPECRNEALAAYLKCVRCVSLLNASIALMEKGFYQEAYILCRAIDEAGEDIIFFLARENENEISQNQIRHLKDFYQEELSDPKNSTSNQVRDVVLRRKIRNQIARIALKGEEATKFVNTVSSIYATLSGFVHGAYGHIMELYGGNPPKYHMNGMSRTARQSESEEFFPSYIFRTIMNLRGVSYRAGSKETIGRLDMIQRELVRLCGPMHD